MRALTHHPLDQGGGVDADPRGHLDQVRRRHIGVTLMGFGHVLIHGDMAAALGTAHMAGDTRVILEDLDSPISEPDVYPTADQPVRHRVKGLVDFDVIIRMHLGRFPLGVFEWLAGQRRQRSALDLLEQLPAGFTAMAHRSIVQLLEQLANRGIEIGQVEEPPMPQPGQNPALDNQHGAFDLALVAWLAAAGRQNRRVVVLGHRRKSLVERRLEPQRLDDPGLQIVADDRFGNSAEV